MSYFLSTAVNIEGNNKLRTPQIEAYLKIKSFFSSADNTEALVVLPTGTGKSGLISIAPFGTSTGRVLIVTPGLVTKDSIRKTQEALYDNFWINYDILFSHKDLPITVEYSAGLLQQHLDDSNIVYSNIQQLSNNRGNALINTVPNDYFDVIIIDEAHHAPADSWVQLLGYFAKAKKLYVTGTPYRGDGQKLPGTLIHETQLSEVMRDRYVKWLRKETVNAHSLFFTVADHPGKKFTIDEVIDLKDKEWVERSVALSEECSKDVIEHSIGRLAELKQQSPKVPHKILAIGCSISHAEDLKAWYLERGLSVALVHSMMDADDVLAEFRRIDGHEVEVVVSVNMLMEGYDHKYLTILALFRPYRSINAFAQIVGRVLRAIPPEEISAFEIDNNALIIYHQETGLDEMWRIFQTEVDRAKHQRTREYEFLERDYVERDNSLGGVVTVETFSGNAESYLADLDFNELFKQKRKEINEAAEAQLSEIQKSGDFDEETLKRFKEVLVETKTKEASQYIDPNLVEKRPALARQELRKILAKKIQDETASLLSDRGLSDKGTELCGSFKRIISYIKLDAPNDGVLVIYINHKLYSRFGKREALENKTLMQALEYVPAIVEELRGMLR
ncbi:DEAD/DEAH box helicase family protein [Pseudomonas sp. SH10-3B]|uniref:DEAD/DEAH box helicase n=1 Tax=Pseudomonas sp. SH10-3B TaxID=2816049 RepID=UPI001CA6095C|nr:DEAD/DEAH box helicase family protein [Pseudomonas sp. SH10-3B]MBY8946315.1 DEAD/DEAH box helicase family protein [Pseudomonas sp. SH10-3B]